MCAAKILIMREHHFETTCKELGVKHIYTKPYRPQTNVKIEASGKLRIMSSFAICHLFQKKILF